MCLLRPPEPRTPDWAAETTDLAFLQNREVEVAAASVPLRPLSLAAVSSHGFSSVHTHPWCPSVGPNVLFLEGRRSGWMRASLMAWF